MSVVWSSGKPGTESLTAIEPPTLPVSHATATSTPEPIPVGRKTGSANAVYIRR